MKLSNIILLSSLSFIGISYAICAYIYDDWRRYCPFYLIEGKNDMKAVFLKEVQIRSTIDVDHFFEDQPEYNIPEKDLKKYDFTPTWGVFVDSLNINNIIYTFTGNLDKNKMVIRLYDWHFPSKPSQRFYIFDGRRYQMIDDLLAEHIFKKEFLSNLGTVHDNEIVFYMFIYADFFFWNQLIIYLILFILWFLTKLFERKLRKKRITVAIG